MWKQPNDVELPSCLEMLFTPRRQGSPGRAVFGCRAGVYQWIHSTAAVVFVGRLDFGRSSSALPLLLWRPKTEDKPVLQSSLLGLQSHVSLGAGCLREDMFFAAMEEAWLKLKTENDAIHSPSRQYPTVSLAQHRSMAVSMTPIWGIHSPGIHRWTSATAYDVKDSFHCGLANLGKSWQGRAEVGKRVKKGTQCRGSGAKYCQVLPSIAKL